MTPIKQNKNLLGKFSIRNGTQFKMKWLLRVWILIAVNMLVSTFSQAQQLNRELQLKEICNDYENVEFLSIKKEISFTKEDFLSSYLQLLNLTPNSEMKFVRSQTNDVGVTSSLYQQYCNGYLIKGAEMMINEQNGRVKYINGRYMTTQPNSTVHTIDGLVALEKAYSEVESKDYLWKYPEAEAAYRRFKKDSTATYKTKAELMYFPNLAKPFDIQSFRLAWRCAVYVNPQKESTEIFIDAITGEVIDKIPLTYECSAGTSTTLWNGAQTLYTQLSGGSYRTLGDCNSAQVHTYNGNGNDNGVGATYYTDADNAWPNTSLGKYIAQTHWGNKETRDYYFAIHGRNGYDDAGADFITYINPGYVGNAYWTGSGTSFGGSSTGADPYVTLDVCGHEHTHGMIDYTSNLTYSYESGALNESFADCLGEAVEEYALGAADWIHRFEINSGNRSFISPNDKTDPDTYLGTYWWTTAGDAGGVHTNSGVQNYWFYLLSVGGSGTNDNGDAFNVSGITIDKARMIAYDCMIGLISSSQYVNARSVSIQKAKDRYGDCSEEAKQTTNAWRAVGVGAAFGGFPSITVNVSLSNSTPCSGSSITATASGASTYTWSSLLGSGNPKVITPTSTSTYTVTGTDAESCTGTKSFTLDVNPLPTVVPTAIDNNLCLGQSTTVSAGANQTLNSLTTTLAGGNGLTGNVFDVHAYNNITITDFKMNLQLGTDSAEIWYNPGGYGNANVTSNTGWTKLGATVGFTSAGPGQLTTIPTTVNLTIGAGSTYGIAIVTNGSNIYSNGTAVGNIAASNSDLFITEGHGGSGFGGTLNFTLSPRVFNGSVVYRTNFTGYTWSPSSSLSSATISNPSATPSFTTTYTVTATDGNGCSNTGTAKVYVNSGPSVTTTLTPSSLCIGGNAALTASGISVETDNLQTPLDANNGNAGNVFNVTASPNKSITINSVSMVIETGTQAEVWYKAGGYGGANLTSSTGWTKLGNTVNITPNGAGVLTSIFITSSLVIPAGQTYGLAIVCDGSNDYTNGTSVGNVLSSNPDLTIYEGHGGVGFGGTFNFTNSPRNFNGRITYTVSNEILGYSWSPSTGLSNASISNPTTTPIVSTSYTVTVTDADGCTSTEIERIYVGNKPQFTLNVTPNSACAGTAQQLTTTSVGAVQTDALFTKLQTNNGYGPNGGIIFDVTTTKQITLTSVSMNIDTGATQAEVWYKPSSYGNASVTSNAGYTKLGSTVAIVGAGLDNLTSIPISTTLNIPAGSTYALAIVTDGSVNYINGTTVGAVYASNPDLSIKQGHGGPGFGGAFDFINSPRVFSGQLGYSVVHTLDNFAWTPATNISNTSISNPVVTPTVSSSYSVTVTDNAGCTATGSIGVQVMTTPLGSATASPTNLCLGNNITLNYTAPAGSQCNGVVQAGFAGSFAPATWTSVLTNSNGTINTVGAPNSIIMTSSNGLVNSGTTGYQHVMPCSGYVTFNWSYSTIDAGPQYDFPRYTINGGSAITFPGYIAQSGHPKAQTGTFSLFLNAGETLQLQMHSSDNIGGAGTLTITNFKAPYQTTSTQTVQWFPTLTGGSSMSSLNPYTFASNTTGPLTYYAQVTNVATGCVNSTRVATNIISVDAPNTAASATLTTICEGGSTTLNATGGISYTWMPGSLSGATVVVSPTTTTTYTVTGTSALGCTKTATVTILVNPLPVVSGSASPSIVCPGASVTLTGTTPGATFNWQPGNLNGSPVVVNPTVQTTYTVTVTSAAGCVNSATFVILMNPVPTVTTSVVPANATICAGSAATITANSPTATAYSWQPGGGIGANLIVTLANTYTVTVTNSQGCTNSATRTITVNPLPTIGTSVTNATICNGQSTAMTGSGALTYIWQPGNLTGTTVNVAPTTTTTYTVTGTNANGCTNTALRTITVNNLPNITTSATLTTINCGGSSTLTASGGVSYVWQPGGSTSASIVVSPTTTTTYTVTGTGANGCTKTATRTITVNPCPTSTLNVKAFLSGYYLGASTMESTLMNQGLPNPSTHCDSINVDLHRNIPPYDMLFSYSGVLLTNGTIACTYPPATIGNSYYIVLKHRNSIETWSANAVTFSSSFSYDFSNLDSKAYGSNQKFLSAGVFGLYSGDVNQDGSIDALDYLILDPDIQAGNSGYLSTDLNGDGSVDALDYLIMDPNIQAGIGLQTP